MSTADDIRKHIGQVRVFLIYVSDQLVQRSAHHDESKLRSPEQEVFDRWRSTLDTLDIESAEYRDALAQMGAGLKHHYQANRHHPEHFPDGINGMTLVDVLEMVCDWKAAAQRLDPNGAVNLRWARERFGIDSQLLRIIENTLKEL
jgi:hypothetical protein